MKNRLNEQNSHSSVNAKNRKSTRERERERKQTGIWEEEGGRNRKGEEGMRLKAESGRSGKSKGKRRGEDEQEDTEVLFKGRENGNYT